MKTLVVKDKSLQCELFIDLGSGESLKDPRVQKLFLALAASLVDAEALKKVSEAIENPDPQVSLFKAIVSDDETKAEELVAQVKDFSGEFLYKGEFLTLCELAVKLKRKTLAKLIFEQSSLIRTRQ